MTNNTTISIRTIFFVCAITICACSQAQSHPPDVFVCVNTGQGHHGDFMGNVGDTMEFRSDGSVYIPPMMGKWKAEGDKITITLDVRGTTLVYVGHQGEGVDATITFDYDGSIWKKKPSSQSNR
jgi:hypothetical protein